MAGLFLQDTSGQGCLPVGQTPIPSGFPRQVSTPAASRVQTSLVFVPGF